MRSRRGTTHARGRRAQGRAPAAQRATAGRGGEGGAWERGAFGRGGHSHPMSVMLDTSHVPISPYACAGGRRVRRHCTRAGLGGRGCGVHHERGVFVGSPQIHGRVQLRVDLECVAEAAAARAPCDGRVYKSSAREAHSVSTRVAEETRQVRGCSLMGSPASWSGAGGAGSGVDHACGRVASASVARAAHTPPSISIGWRLTR